MSKIDSQEFFENFLNQQEYFRSKEEMDDLELLDISDNYSFEDEECLG
jgi:hypothetical protein